MTMFQGPAVGMPGVYANPKATPRQVFAAAALMVFLPGGRLIDGNATSDPLNTDDVTVARAGLLMGKIAASGKYGSSVIGVTTAALGGNQTTLKAATETITELVRRQGASGTFTLTGAPTAAGTARTRTVTYSAASGTSITISADLAAAVNAGNQIEALAVADDSGTGSFTLTIEGITTAAITYNATPATVVNSINTALNAAFGTSAIVASGASLAAIILTFSGTGYAGRPIVGHVTSTITQTGTGLAGGVYTINGSSTAGTSTTTTLGVTAVAADEGEFAAGAIIGPTDGSQVPLSFIGDGYGVKVSTPAGVRTTTTFSANGALGFAISGVIDPTNLLNYSTANASVQAWIKAALNTNGRFAFTDSY